MDADGHISGWPGFSESIRLMISSLVSLSNIDFMVKSFMTVKPLRANDWFHVRIVVHSPHITVYVNGSELPTLSVDKLDERRKSRIGLWVGNNSGGSFANLKIVDE